MLGKGAHAAPLAKKTGGLRAHETWVTLHARRCTAAQHPAALALPASASQPAHPDLHCLHRMCYVGAARNSHQSRALACFRSAAFTSDLSSSVSGCTRPVPLDSSCQNSRYRSKESDAAGAGAKAGGAATASAVGAAAAAVATAAGRGGGACVAARAAVEARPFAGACTCAAGALATACGTVA